MLANQELLNLLAFLSVFLITTGLGMILLYMFHKQNRRTRARLRELSEDSAEPLGDVEDRRSKAASSFFQTLGSMSMPFQQKQSLPTLNGRLIQAGYYNPQATTIYFGIQLLGVLVLPLALGVPPFVFQWMQPWQALLCGVAGLCLGLLLPGLWLGTQQTKRRRQLRKAFPDALDMLVLCVDGGISLVGAIQRVTGELHLAHPILAGEMNIVQREIELGLSAGESMKHFAERCELKEVHHLASLLLQADKYGASITGALAISADDLRTERKQEAEETAQKAAVKILFPMLLFIFPTIFIVLLGPAAIQISKMFAATR